MFNSSRSNVSRPSGLRPSPSYSERPLNQDRQPYSERPTTYERRRTDGSNYQRSNNYNEHNNQQERRKLRVYVGDMVKIIDERSRLFGKFGLVEQIHPGNLDWQVIVKVGPYSNKMRFRQLRFCTRIGKEPRFYDPDENRNRRSQDEDADGNFNENDVENDEDSQIDEKVSQYIDSVSKESKEDNIGNR